MSNTVSATIFRNTFCLGEPEFCYAVLAVREPNTDCTMLKQRPEPYGFTITAQFKSELGMSGSLTARGLQTDSVTLEPQNKAIARSIQTESRFYFT